MNAVAIAGSHNQLTIDELHVLELVEAALRDSGYRDLRRVRCQFNDGVLTLEGQIPSYFLKQMAQAVAARVPGVMSISNQLRVS